MNKTIVISLKGPINVTYRLPWFVLLVLFIDIESHQNRLLKVCYVPCYVPATSAHLPRLLFIFLAAAIDSTNEANNVGGMCH